jgi:hypothetical protein
MLDIIHLAVDGELMLRFTGQNNEIPQLRLRDLGVKPSV